MLLMYETHEVVFQNSHPHHFREKSDLWGFGDVKIELEHLYPCGLIVRPAIGADPASPPSFRDIDVLKVRKLAELQSPINPGPGIELLMPRYSRVLFAMRVVARMSVTSGCRSQQVTDSRRPPSLFSYEQRIPTKLRFERQCEGCLVDMSCAANTNRINNYILRLIQISVQLPLSIAHVLLPTIVRSALQASYHSVPVRLTHKSPQFTK